jgi:ankyrin repeat protein
LRFRGGSAPSHLKERTAYGRERERSAGLSQNGHLDVVRALITAKADVNEKAANGFTALNLASETGHLEVVRALVAAKADVNANQTDGETALSLATKGGFAEIVQLLKASLTLPNL